MAGPAKRDVEHFRAALNNNSPFTDTHHAEPALDRVVQAQIGDKLRAMYGELIGQPVPDRFVAILNRLETSRGGSNS